MALTSMQTQGQLDWVSLTNFGMNCTLDIAARLTHGGVDICTVLVGRGVCSAFDFPSDGQKALKESLTNLKGYSAFDKMLWYGFGIKSIVHILSETEQGAACVAISAALAMYYTPYYAAEVWREFCLRKGTPRQYSPSVHQWKALVEACAGSLSRSNFMNHFDQFSRWLAPKISPRREPASPAELARALEVLADLSRKHASSVLFVGGVECAWLAAVATHLLCLPIEIVDEADATVCLWHAEPNLPIRATFKPGMSATRGTALVRSVCFVSSGAELLRECVDFLTPAIRYRSSWSTVLSDTFPQWCEFIESSCSKRLNELLKLVASNAQVFFSSSSQVLRDHPHLPWWLFWGTRTDLLYHPRRTGQNLYQFALDTFPELHKLPATTQIRTDASEEEIISRMIQVAKEIQSFCFCSLCSGTSSKSHQPRLICFHRLSLTIVRLVLILSPVVKIDKDIPLVPGALKQLYNCCTEPEFLPMDTVIPPNGVEIVLYLFTDQYNPRSPGRRELRATGASIGGVCVFLALLKELNQSTEELIGIEVIPGQIQFENRTYQWITDISDIERVSTIPDIFHHFSRRSLVKEALQIELIVKETEERQILAASYQVSLRSDPFIMRLAAVEDLLRCCLNFHNCSCELSPGSFEAGGLIHQWSAAKSSDGSDERGGDGQLGFNFHKSWMLVDWHAYQLPGTPNWNWQHVDIDIYCGEPDILTFLLLLLDNKRSRSVRMSSRTAVVSGCCGLDCIIRVVLSDWSKDGTETNPPTAQADLGLNLLSKLSTARKKISIRAKSLLSGYPDSRFTLDVRSVAGEQKAGKSKNYAWDIIRRISGTRDQE
jgi:hypothetical protein